MTRAVLSLSSNMGDRLGYFQMAVDRLADVLVAVSPVYETEPWGVLDQDVFLNMIVIAEADQFGPREWLERARLLEEAAERHRTIHWGPRTLDVDVVTVDELRVDEPDLIVPHPGAHERATVIVPWLDIEPDAGIPGHGKIGDLVTDLDTSGVWRRDDLRLHLP